MSIEQQPHRPHAQIGLRSPFLLCPRSSTWLSARERRRGTRPRFTGVWREQARHRAEAIATDSLGGNHSAGTTWRELLGGNHLAGSTWREPLDSLAAMKRTATSHRRVTVARSRCLSNCNHAVASTRMACELRAAITIIRPQCRSDVEASPERSNRSSWHITCRCRLTDSSPAEFRHV